MHEKSDLQQHINNFNKILIVHIGLGVEVVDEDKNNYSIVIIDMFFRTHGDHFYL